MLQRQLKVNSALLRGRHDCVPFLRHAETELPKWPGFWPIEILSVPVIHPHTRPVLAGRAQFGHYADDVRHGAGVPGDVMPHGKIAAAIARDESTGSRWIDPHKPRADRRTGDRPG